jgi:hypothetical protein
VRDEAEHKGDSGAVGPGARRCRDAEGVTYLNRLSVELAAVGIRGRLRDRILAEAADHLAEGEPSQFGDPGELARQFAEELATDRSRRAALGAFAALALAGLGVGAAFLVIASASGPPADVTSADWLPAGLVAVFGMLFWPQVALAAGVLALLRALRRRREPRLPAAEVALLLRRTRVALAAGALSLASLALQAIEYRQALSSWYVLSATIGAGLLLLPLGGAAVLAGRAAAVRSTAPGEAGDVFDDLPLSLPRRPWLLCAATAGCAALASLIGGGIEEGPRNAVAEIVLVVAGFLALGKRLVLRR